MQTKTHLKISALSFFLCFSAYGQDRLIYHTRSQEQVKIYGSDKQAVSSESMRLTQGGKVRIRIINPNPLFYKYELRYAEQEVQSEDQEITAALAQIGALLTNKNKDNRRIALTKLQVHTDTYITKVAALMAEINAAQIIIDNSDLPESEADMLAGTREGGLRYAIDQITRTSQQESSSVLTSGSCGFHDPKLLESLNNLLEPMLIAGIDSNQLKIYKLVNSTLAKKVQEMKKNLTEVKAEIDQEFTVTDKEAIIYLIITPIDAARNNLRKLHTEESKLEVARIIPDFKRAVIELVPVGNILFSGNYQQYYLEDGIVGSRAIDNKIMFRPGLVVNINLLSFGESREMAVGVGLGYSFNHNESDFENLYFSTLFSYKSFFRVGFGLGWGQFPSGLKSGGEVGQTLPDNISDLEHLVSYEYRPTAFLTLAFTALNLTKKK